MRHLKAEETEPQDSEADRPQVQDSGGQAGGNRPRQTAQPSPVDHYED